MTARVHDAWEGLRKTQAEGQGGYRLSLMHASEDTRVFAALEAVSGAPGVLVDLPVGALRRDPRDLLCKAFTVTTAPFPGMAANRVGVLTLLRNFDYEDLFGLLAGDILEAVVATEDSRHAASEVARVIERWRYFMERRRASMTDDRVRGLIGELLVLGRLLSSGYAVEVLTSWTGPHDAIHDFELPDHSVEVKTFLAEDGPTVRISDPRQLDVVRARTVHLVAIKLARSTSGRPLPEMIHLLTNQLAHAPEAAELFEKKLAEYGYLPNHAALYTEPFACEQVLAYAVQEGFPRIRVDEVPAAVSDIQYSLSLTALAAFTIDSAAILGASTSILETGRDD